MKFKRRIRVDTGLKRIEITPLIDCIFLLLVFFMLTSNFVIVRGINVNLPKTKSSDSVSSKTTIVTISSEDIIYVDGVIFTESELEKFLKSKKLSSLYIKADRDASVGSVALVWDICKKIGIEKIGIATINTANSDF